MSNITIDSVVIKEKEKIQASICSSKTYEICPHCENEVELNAKIEVQKCPECKENIKPCSLCINCITPCIYDETLVKVL